MNKYHARKTTRHGIKFDSKREADRYDELLLLERAGVISDIERQVSFPLKGENGPILTPTGRQANYRADFRYHDKQLNAWVVEDAKGHPTREYLLKKAILAASGVEVKEV